ncbi:MAG: AMP-binding protein, partial [Gemmataceae bacterium]
ILADTIAAAFVERALQTPQEIAVADDRSGVLTYEKMLVGSLLMARRFRALPGDALGVLLPAAAACDITLQGLYLAGKLPVLLNWTTGPANLAHAAKLMKLDCTITSRAVIDRLGLTLPETRFIYLEDIGKEISIWEKLSTLLRVRWMPGSVRAMVPQPAPDSPAVVLFTSGSEKAPKAVPLTHRNLITNQRDALKVFGVDRRNSMLGFLPAFHSFGMSITGLFPLLSGFRVVRHPDPTDAAALARKVGLFQTTILVGTPTFVNYILDRAEPGELASLRLVVVGAEKCPQAVFDKMKLAAPEAIITEGYGITECSPTVSVNPPNAVRPGTVGKPFPSVKLKHIDLDTEQELGPNQMGMLLVGGPTVFPGYIGSDAPQPFKQIDGERWYVTGDLAELTDEGYIRFRGRLKRFIKVGGEMVSLPALEEPLARMYPPTKDGPRVAVEGVELEGGGRRIVLFTTEDITVNQANDILLKEGFHGVMRLDEVRKIDAIPVLGTGKTDYKILRAKILQPAELTP